MTGPLDLRILSEGIAAHAVSVITHFCIRVPLQTGILLFQYVVNFCPKDHGNDEIIIVAFIR